MTAWLREEEHAPNNRQRKREADEADKVEVVSGVTVASLIHFRAALKGPPKDSPSGVGCGNREAQNVVDAIMPFFLSFRRFCLFPLILSSNIFLSSRPRTRLATAYITGHG